MANKTVATKTKDLLASLGRRGPYGVNVGDLGFTSRPGQLFVPAGAPSPAPLIGLAHDWATSASSYARTATHLASWGFVVVLPNSSRSPLARQSRFADELSASMEDVLASTLGSGEVRADARRIGVAGHGMGASIAADLATRRTDISGVAMLFPRSLEPVTVERVTLADAPALITSAEGGTDIDIADTLSLTWRGPVVHRRLSKTTEAGLLERSPVLSAFGLPGGNEATRRAVRPLLAGFLLATVAGDATYAAFASDSAKLGGSILVTPDVIEADARSAEKAAAKAARAQLRTPAGLLKAALR